MTSADLAPWRGRSAVQIWRPFKQIRTEPAAAAALPDRRRLLFRELKIQRLIRFVILLFTQLSRPDLNNLTFTFCVFFFLFIGIHPDLRQLKFNKSLTDINWPIIHFFLPFSMHSSGINNFPHSAKSDQSKRKQWPVRNNKNNRNNNNNKNNNKWIEIENGWN